MFPAPSSYTHTDNGPSPWPANPAGTSSSYGTEENEPSTTDDLEKRIYHELWQEVLANTPESPSTGSEPFVYSSTAKKDDSRSTIREYLLELRMAEVQGDAKTLFSCLQAAVDEQSWPLIPYIRKTHLVQSQKFPYQPNILIGCNIRSYALNQRTGTLKLLTLRGIVTITTLSEWNIGNIGIDPNIKHALNCIADGGRQKIIREASFARRRGNGANALQFLVFGLRFGRMSKMGFIFCKDPEEPSSGPTGHITLRCSPNMTDDALIRRESSNRSKESRGSAASDLVPGPATVQPACCPYCSKGFHSMDTLRNHLLRIIQRPSASDVEHPEDEISEFMRNARKPNPQNSPLH